MIPGMLGTVTLTVASGMLGRALAWISVEPPGPEIPVIGTDTLLLPAVIVAVDGTVARLMLSEWRLIVRAFGVTAESASVTFCVVPPVIVTGPAGKLTVAVTLTMALLAV